MPQVMYGLLGQEICTLEMPDPNEELMPHICWGQFDQLFTPAFWYGQAWLDSETKVFSSYRIGTTLKEEVTACLLGGHGIPSEVGLAAYRAICISGILDQSRISLEDIYAVLQQPLDINGCKLKYRFVRQKSAYLCAALARLSEEEPPLHSALAFRNYFLRCKGIGPKTASWITRNWLNSHEVAIIDIHIHRAGLMCGFFKPSQNVARDYFPMEKKFLEFANALGIQASILDALIWRHMKAAGKAAFSAFHKYGSN